MVRLKRIAAPVRTGARVGASEPDHDHHGLALAAPLALLALYSFWTQKGLVLDTHFTLAQYTSAFGRASFRALFYRSLGISSIVTLITVRSPIRWPISSRSASRSRNSSG